jgi:hypothetical protein
MGVNDWVHDEGEVQRSVEAITEFFRSNPLLGIYTALLNFVYRGRQVFLNFNLKSYTNGVFIGRLMPPNGAVERPFLLF